MANFLTPVIRADYGISVNPPFFLPSLTIPRGALEPVLTSLWGDNGRDTVDPVFNAGLQSSVSFPVPIYGTLPFSTLMDVDPPLGSTSFSPQPFPIQSGSQPTLFPSAQHLGLDFTQRNQDRLMQRVKQAEAENEVLRDVNRANRADLIRVEDILERVLAMNDLGAEAYESLSQITQMLMVVKNRSV